MASFLPSNREYSFRRELPVFLLMLAVVFAVYWQALSNGFLLNWDDPNYVTNNLDAHGFSLEHIKNAFSRFYVGNYAPLHILSYMLDYSLFGLKPSGYISHNILLHVFNGYLLYLFICRITALFYPSIISALLFLVHPVQVESVVWISQRKNLLAMLFFLGAMHLYLSYRNHAAEKRAVFYLFSLFLFACALLTKSVAVILPVGLLFYDVFIERRALRSALFDKLPFIAIAFAAATVAMLSQSEDFGGGGRTVFHGGSPWATFLTMMPVFVSYLRMLILPLGLSSAYSPEIKTALDLQVAASGVILLLLAGYAWFLRSKSPELFFWLAFGVIGIIPVSQIVPLVTMMNDRYLYFPLAGIAPFIVLNSLRIFPADRRLLRNLATGFLLCILILFGTMSGKRSVAWKDSLTLWRVAVMQNPKNIAAKYNLANEYFLRADLANLRIILQELFADLPNSARNHEMLGHYYYLSSDLENAENSYKKALELSPKLANSYFCLGNINLARSDLKTAEVFFQKAAEHGLMTPEFFYSIACLESLKGNVPKALSNLSEAFSLGFRGCSAVRANRELNVLRGRPEYDVVIKTYCSEGEVR